MLGQSLPLLLLKGASASGDTFTAPVPIGKNGTGSPVDLRDCDGGLLMLDVQALGSADTQLTVNLMCQDPVLSTPTTPVWVQWNTFGTVTATGPVALPVLPGGIPDQTAVQYVISGTTPSVNAAAWIAARRR